MRSASSSEAGRRFLQPHSPPSTAQHLEDVPQPIKQGSKSDDFPALQLPLREAAQGSSPSHIRPPLQYDRLPSVTFSSAESPRAARRYIAEDDEALSSPSPSRLSRGLCDIKKSLSLRPDALKDIALHKFSFKKSLRRIFNSRAEYAIIKSFYRMSAPSRPRWLENAGVFTFAATASVKSFQRRGVRNF